MTWRDGRYETWSWDDWRRHAARFAAGLRTRGVQPGDRVACLLSNSAESCAAVLGAWMSGACLLSLPLIARGMEPARYVAQLRRIVRDSAPVLMVADAPTAELLGGADVGARVVPYHELDVAELGEATFPDADHPCFVQYSSGSTTEPKGCVLTSAAIAWQLEALVTVLDVDPVRDTSVMWLPLSHDMGLFGALLLTYWGGHRLALSTPERFLTQPTSWLDDCSRFRGTIVATPSFGLDIAARAAARRLPGPLVLRNVVVGGDRIEPRTLTRATEALGAERLPASSLRPAYGLAEGVLAVTMAPLGAGPTVAELDAEALEAGEPRPAEARDGARATSLVSAGPPLPGIAVTAGEPDARAGEIVVDTPSLASGYLDDPAATASRFTADGLRTGDQGFLLEGELYVTGRIDDLMLVGGRNVYARDIELALSEVAGVRPGGCAVVDAGDGGASTRLVALVETVEPDADTRTVARRLGDASREAAGVALDECVFVPRGTLPKTPSGKVQRFRCREIAAANGALPYPRVKTSVLETARG